MSGQSLFTVTSDLHFLRLVNKMAAEFIDVAAMEHHETASSCENEVELTAVGQFLSLRNISGIST